MSNRQIKERFEYLLTKKKKGLACAVTAGKVENIGKTLNKKLR